MAMTVSIGSELELLVRQKAHLEGRDPAEVIESLLFSALDWESRDYDEAVEGIRRGLEASEAGRVRPAADVSARMRQQLDEARQ